MYRSRIEAAGAAFCCISGAGGVEYRSHINMTGTVATKMRRPYLRKLRAFTLLVVACIGISCRDKAQPPAAPPAPAVRNVLLITIDTLRADALSVYGGPVPAPALAQLAQRGAVFEHAFTSAPITLPAHTSLMSGLIPPVHGVRNNGTFRAPASLKLLAEYAQARGMKTGAVVGAFPLAAQFGLNQASHFTMTHLCPRRARLASSSTPNEQPGTCANAQRTGSTRSAPRTFSGSTSSIRITRTWITDSLRSVHTTMKSRTWIANSDFFSIT